MRSNSGHGKSSNNLRDPTMKEHGKAHDKSRTEMKRGDEERDDRGTHSSDR